MPVQRSALGLLGNVASLGQSLWSAGNSQKQAQAAMKKNAAGPTADAFSPQEIRKLAARVYPFVSQRLKSELARDRERAGMITGLHR
ncbi:MAG: hypothetical protein JWM85_2076 [Acidimicrobiaceae bacterium]|nr:hypothetical protein [Acidimicrobiaceae bacterium]